MRGAWIGLSFGVAMLVSAGTGLAQGALEGPLGAPDASIAAPVGKTPGTKQKNHRARKADMSEATKARATSASLPEPKTASETVNPLSLGMKWSGSNDNAEQTRVQNYGGAAAGTGAEVGLKLHF